MAFTNLDYLRNITGGDPDSIREIIMLFIEQVPDFVGNMKKHLSEKNYSELGKEAHKAKSSVLILGMNDLGIDLKMLQLATINKTAEDTYAQHVNRFEKDCEMAIKELQQELLLLKQI